MSDCLNYEEFKNAIKTKGCFMAHNYLEDHLVQRLRDASINAIQKEVEYHGTTNFKDYGAVQVCPLYGGAFIDILDVPKFVEPFEKIMGEGCIIWSYITSSMPPEKPNFTSRIHVDRPRLFPGYCESLGALVLLSDFNEENGATWYLEGSHERLEQPSEEEFYKDAKRIIASAGSVFYFNLRLWHAGGINLTNDWRHAISIGMVRPYLKQKFDLPGMLQNIRYDIDSISSSAKQKLGFNAIPPKSLDEFWGKNGVKKTYTELSEWKIAESGF